MSQENLEEKNYKKKRRHKQIGPKKQANAQTNKQTNKPKRTTTNMTVTESGRQKTERQRFLAVDETYKAIFRPIQTLHRSGLSMKGHLNFCVHARAHTHIHTHTTPTPQTHMHHTQTLKHTHMRASIYTHTTEIGYTHTHTHTHTTEIR